MLRIDDIHVSLTRQPSGWTTFFSSLRSIPVLQGLSLELAAGEITAVLGCSGSGKTTLLRAAAGLVPIAKGRVLLNGSSLQNLPPHRRGIHLLFQTGNCYDHWRVIDHLRFDRGADPDRRRSGGRPHQQSAETDPAAEQLTNEQILDETGLSSVADRYPPELSGGMRQRLGVARAMASDRSVVLLDEPLVHLDAGAKWQLLPLIVRLKELGKAVCYVTHELDDASLLADRVAILSQGQIVHCDRFRSIWENPPSVAVAALTTQLPLQSIPLVEQGLVRSEQVELADPATTFSTAYITTIGQLIDRRWLAGRSLWTVEVQRRLIQSVGSWPIDHIASGQPVCVAIRRASIAT